MVTDPQQASGKSSDLESRENWPAGALFYDFAKPILFLSNLNFNGWILASTEIRQHKTLGT